MSVFRIDLGGTWCLKDENLQNICEAKVPGSVIDSMYKAGLIEHPYYRDNEYRIREMFNNDYILEREFSVPEEILVSERLEFVAEGLDTLAETEINGVKVLSADNMHRTYRVPVKDVVHAGVNTLRITFRSVLQYIRDYEYKPGKEVHAAPTGAMLGSHLLRKAHSMFGWDWGPQLIDAGIWRDIYIEAISGSRLTDLRVRQTHQEDGTVRLSAEAIFDAGLAAGTELKVYDPDDQIIWEYSAEDKAETQVLIEKPRLWWPVGCGEQPLYRVTAETPDGQRIEKKIGLRTMTISQEKDRWGSEFCFCVNGRKIFARGGDYIPEDAVYPWITDEQIDYLLQSCVRANFNCLRVWGGGYYPSDFFYDLCDKYGLIVWQDLMFACHVYDVTGSFEKNAVEEIRDNVRRIRHHASLGLWCGNNEIETGWVNWSDFQKESLYLRADYIKLFEHTIPAVMAEEDPDTFFWVSSPSSGGCMDDPEDENRGDTHYWQVWHGQKPFEDYQNHYFRFCSEFGFQSFPAMKTLETFAEAEDMNIFSEVMESHQKNPAANGKILYYLSENFRYPKDLSSVVYISQVLQAMAMKSGVEHFRRNRGRCMGALYWQVNDNWPVASWASIDYYGRWKALHYDAKRFYAPVAASIRRKDGIIALHLVNDTEKALNVTASLRIKSLHFDVIKEWTCTASVESDSAACLIELKENELPSDIDKREVFVEGTVTDDLGRTYTECAALVPYKYLNLKNPGLRYETVRTEDGYEIAISADSFAPFVEAETDGVDVILSDNYFMISDKAPYVITLKDEDIRNGRIEDAADLAKKLTLRSIWDTYEH